MPEKVLMDCKELVLVGDKLEEIPRLPGENDVSAICTFKLIEILFYSYFKCVSFIFQCGMVAWRMKLSTPEYPDGREIILIANDLTFLIGSFGPREDILFNKASILARQLKVPRVSGCE